MWDSWPGTCKTAAIRGKIIGVPAGLQIIFWSSAWLCHRFCRTRHHKTCKGCMDIACSTLSILIPNTHFDFGKQPICFSRVPRSFASGTCEAATTLGGAIGIQGGDPAGRSIMQHSVVWQAVCVVRRRQNKRNWNWKISRLALGLDPES